MIRSKVTPPKPIEGWYKNQENVEGLREILASPFFHLAAASLISAAQPSVRSQAADPVANNNRLAWLAGYNDAFNDLEKLTKHPTTNAFGTTTHDEWGHIAATPSK